MSGVELDVSNPASAASSVPVRRLEKSCLSAFGVTVAASARLKAMASAQPFGRKLVGPEYPSHTVANWIPGVVPRVEIADANLLHRRLRARFSGSPS